MGDFSFSSLVSIIELRNQKEPYGAELTNTEAALKVEMKYRLLLTLTFIKLFYYEVQKL